jgi:uncharacterized protein (DUF1501 family)
MAVPQSYLDAAAAMAAAAAADTSRKTLVCLWLPGAIDSHNMLIPTAGNNKTLYDTWRPVPVTGVDISESPLNDVGGGWRLHPRLGAASPALAGAPSLYDLWTEGKVAAVRGVGTLVRPLTREQYLADRSLATRPRELFAHNTQQDEWMHANFKTELRLTGWFGRMMDLMDPAYNTGQLLETGSLSTSGIRLQSIRYTQGSTPVLPPSLLSTVTTYTGHDNATGRALKMYQASEQNSPVDLNPLAPYTDGIQAPINATHNAFRSAFIAGVRAQRAANTNLLALPSSPTDVTAYFNTTNLPSITDGFGTSQVNPFRTQFETAARAIWSRYQTAGAHFNQRRQVIFITVGGWDHHVDLRFNQDWRLEAMSEAIGVFWKCLQDMVNPETGAPMSESVIMFTESEFSRTFKANANRGTDHAWAGHPLVIGSPTNLAGGLFGPEPDYSIGANRDIDTNLGRYIPDVALEQYYTTLMDWFGIPASLSSLVLPYVDNFTPRNIPFLK